MNGTTIKKYFDTHYPLDLAYDWDNVGLQIGTLNKTITAIMITLDVTQEVYEEAVRKNVNLIITHHPLVFKPLHNILTDAYKGKLIAQLIKADVAVYVSHTNYDLGHTGMNQVLADTLQLQEQRPLEMVTVEHGLGRIGRLKKPLILPKVLNYVKSTLQLEHARLIGPLDDRLVETLAISGGSGAAQMISAKHQGVDLYLTGDVSYHQAHDMLQLGLTTLDIGHYAEQHFAEALKKELSAAGMKVPIHVTTVSLDPFTFV